MRHNKNSSNDGKCRFFVWAAKKVYDLFVESEYESGTVRLLWFGIWKELWSATHPSSLFLSLCVLIVSSCFNKFVFASANNRWFQNKDSDRNRDGDKERYSENA